MQPFLSMTVDRFAPENPLARFEIKMNGSSEGIGNLCDQLVDVAATARKMTPKEIEACSASGTSLTSIPVARDAIVLFTNKKSSNKIDCLTVPQIYSLVGPESAGFKRWSDGMGIASQLSETSTLPKIPLTVIGPPQTSGTVDLLIDQTISPFSQARQRSSELRPDYRALASDAMIPGEVSRVKNSIGFADYEKAQRWRSEVRFLEVDSGRGCVPATAATIRAGSYALSRSQFLFVSLKAAAANPTLAAFISFALEPAQLVDEGNASGISLAPKEIDAANQIWSAAADAAGVSQ
uniref:Unannotated protein n=1 Tax=freshwater metagenome TaxID=449393 RepID=A0A6J5ZWB6_9ZZZZ